MPLDLTPFKYSILPVKLGDLEKAEKLYETIRKVSLLDDRTNMTFGERASFSDYIGIPWKIIHGNGSYTLKSRDESVEQKFSSLNGLSKILEEINQVVIS